MDTLTVEGVGRQYDGTYPCDIVGMLTLTSDEALTNDEAHLIKRLSGVRGNEIPEAFLAGDTDVRMAVTIIVLARHGKTIDERILGPRPAGSAVFAFDDAEPPEEEEHPTDESRETEASLSNNSGRTSTLTLANQEPDPEVIGVPA